MSTQKSLSHCPAPIGDGTAGQITSERDKPWDKVGTFSLKALANQAFEAGHAKGQSRDKT